MNLIRVDDRLIHGQVVVGWAGKLKPDYIILANDEIASSSEDAELYLLGVPFEYEGKVFTVSQAAEFINNNSGMKYILVLKSVADAVELYLAGQGFQNINIGGLHSKEGKREINQYIYVDETDIDNIRILISKNIEICVQDLPDNPKYGSSYILDKWEKHGKTG